MGASVVEWTTLVPCKGLSESDLKIYINIDFFVKIINIFGKHIDVQSQAIFFDINNFKKKKKRKKCLF